MQIRSVYEHWRKKHPRAAPKLATDRPDYKRIRKALEAGYTVDDCRKAIDGIHKDDWSVANKALTLERVFRNEGTVAKFIELTDNNPSPTWNPRL